MLSNIQHTRNMTCTVQFTQGIINDAQLHHVSGEPFQYHGINMCLFYNKFKYVVDTRRLDLLEGTF